MSSLLAPFTHFRTLLHDFVRRDLRSRYVGSSMGFFWSVLFPVINLIVFTFVFRIILKTRWGDEQGALEVAMVMLAGIVVWTAFAESISRSTNCLVDNANLLQKVVFPASIFPAYITLSSVLNMCIGLPIVLGSVVWFGYVAKPTAAIELEHRFQEVYEGYETVGAEGEALPWPRTFVALERAWREPTTFQLEYGGTATRGVDYLAEHDEVTIPAGRSRLYIPIIPLRDSAIEGPETVEVRIADVPDREVTAASITMRLLDNELPPEEVALDLGQATATAVYTSADGGDHHPLALGPSLVMLPVLLGLLVIYTIGLGAFLAAFNLYWRDTFHLVGVGLTVWMFATPIFYPAMMVKATSFKLMLTLNPMHWFVEMFREVTLFGLWPSPGFLIPFTLMALFTFWVGGRFFGRHESKFPDLL